MSGRRLALAGYPLAALLFGVPLVDFVIGAMPFQWSDPVWRFGTTIVFSRALLSPLLGLFVAQLISELCDHGRGTKRTLSLVAGLYALGILATIPLFALDALNVNEMVSAGTETNIYLATGVTVAKFTFVSVVAALIAFSSWRSGSRHAARVAAGREDPMSPIFSGL